MLDLNECKKYIKAPLTDSQVRDLRDGLYALVEMTLDAYLQGELAKEHAVLTKKKMGQNVILAARGGVDKSVGGGTM